MAIGLNWTGGGYPERRLTLQPVAGPSELWEIFARGPGSSLPNSLGAHLR
jgi:hypothetical protein